MASYVIDGSDLTDVADAIRLRGNTSALLGFPKDFVDSIKGIPYNSQPTQTITITSNNPAVDVLHYAYANVNVPGIVPSGTLEIDENGTYDVYDKETVEVDVSSAPPYDERLIESNGLYDISLFQHVNVQVPSINPQGTKTINITQNGTVTENVTNFVNVEIITRASVGAYTDYAYVDVQTSDKTSLEVANPLNVMPKLITVEPLREVAANKLYTGVFTPEIGGCSKKPGDRYPTTWNAWRRVDDVGSSAHVFAMSASAFAVTAHTMSSGATGNNWDTDIAYRIYFYA